MKLSEFLDERWLDADLCPSDRDDALRRIVERLHAAGALSEVEEPLRRLIRREEAMSTAVDPGVALPHTLCPSAPRTVLSVCRVPGGVDFLAPDGTPTELIFTLLGPPDAAGRHVKVLARIARLLKRDLLREALRRAGSAEAIRAAVDEAEREAGL